MVLLARASTSNMLFWCGVAAVIIVGGVLFGKWAARKVKSPYEPYVGPIAGFELADLRRLHEMGELTDEQYDRARKLVVARSRMESGIDETDAIDATEDAGSHEVRRGHGVCEDDDESDPAGQNPR